MMSQPHTQSTAYEHCQQASQFHVALLEELAHLEKAAPASIGNMGTLGERLATLRTQLLEHFRAEEDCGCLDDISQEEPRLTKAVDRLLVEHKALGEALDQLIGMAEAVTHLEQALAGKLSEWIKQMRRHEAQEEALIQKAFNQDFGGAD